MSQIKATNVAEEEKPPKNAFEDFFECSGKSNSYPSPSHIFFAIAYWHLITLCLEIDNQDYSQFINDQSDFVINPTGEIEAEEEEAKTKELDNLDVNTLVTLIRTAQDMP